MTWFLLSTHSLSLGSVTMTTSPEVYEVSCARMAKEALCPYNVHYDALPEHVQRALQESPDVPNTYVMPWYWTLLYFMYDFVGLTLDLIIDQDGARTGNRRRPRLARQL